VRGSIGRTGGRPDARWAKRIPGRGLRPLSRATCRTTMAIRCNVIGVVARSPAREPCGSRVACGALFHSDPPSRTIGATGGEERRAPPPVDYAHFRAASRGRKSPPSKCFDSVASSGAVTPSRSLLLTSDPSAQGARSCRTMSSWLQRRPPASPRRFDRDYADRGLAVRVVTGGDAVRERRARASPDESRGPPRRSGTS
jgi:hypothetical protein